MSARDRGGYGVDDDESDGNDDTSGGSSSSSPSDDDGPRTGGGSPSFPGTVPDDSGGSSSSSSSDDDGPRTGGGSPSFPGTVPDDSSGDTDTRDDGVDQDVVAGGSGVRPVPDDDGNTSPARDDRESDAVDQREVAGGSGVGPVARRGGESSPPRDDGQSDRVNQRLAAGGTGVGPTPNRNSAGFEPDSASDEEIRRTLRQQAAADADVSASDVTITGFEEQGGELVPVIRTDETAEANPASVPDSFRDQFRESATEEFDSISPEDASVTVEDGQLDVVFSGSALQRQRRVQAAEQIDEQIPETRISIDDVRETEEGEFTLTDDAIERLQLLEEQQTPGEVGGGPTGGTPNADPDVDTDNQAQTTTDAQNDQLEPESEPGIAATAIGRTAEAVGDSPVGEALGSVSDRVFGNSAQNNGVAGRIDDYLEDVEEVYEQNITDELEDARQDSIETQPVAPGVGGGIASPFVLRTTAKATEFANPGAIGRDVIRVGRAGTGAASFLAERGPEGAQVAQELAVEGAQQAPSAVSEGAQNVRENPVDAASTAGALVATFGAGAAASGVTRSGASLASRGARRVASRVDDAAGISARTRAAGAAVRDASQRAPDIEIRRDPTAGPLEVDPLLRQQIRSRVRRTESSIDAADDADDSLARRIGAAVEQTQVNARFNADAAASRLRESVPDRSSIPNPRPDTDASIAREAGRRTRRAEINALLNADAATSRIREAVPGRGSLPDMEVFASRDTPLARRLGRRFESEQRSLRLAASAAPSALRQRTSDATDRVTEIVPSRPGDLSFGESDASLARRAGRRFEAERRSLALSAAAAPSVARSRVSNTAEGVFDRINSVAAAPRNTLENVERPDVDFELRDRVPSVPRPDERVRDAISAASEATLRIGPARPARADVDLDELDIELDEFDDDLDFGLDESAGGRTDFESEISTGRGGDGTEQLSVLRSRSGEADDVFEESLQTRRNRQRGGPEGIGKIGSFGIGSIIGSSAFGINDSETSSPTGDAFSPSVESTGISSIFTGTVSVNQAASSTGLTSPFEGIGTTASTSIPTDTAITTNLSTTQIEEQLTDSTSRSPPSRVPDVPEFDGDEDSSLSQLEFDGDEDVFETSVADPSDVLDDMI